MIMNTVWSSILKLDLNMTVDMMLANIQEAVPFSMIIGTLVFCIVIALLWCFFGLKLVRIWALVFGLSIGGIIGVGAAWALGLEEMYILIAAVAVGIILGGICGLLYHVGVFLVVWIAGTAVSAGILQPQELISFLICVGIGLVCALLTLKFTEPVTIVVTGILGALNTGSLLGILTALPGTVESNSESSGLVAVSSFFSEKRWLFFVIVVVLAVLGIVVQFVLESGKRKKMSLRKAKEIREQNSTENEVDKARALIDNLYEEDSYEEESYEDENLDEDEEPDEDDYEAEIFDDDWEEEK